MTSLPTLTLQSEGGAVIDLERIKQAAQMKVDDKGNPVVQIPRTLWQELVAFLESLPPENGYAKALLSELTCEPEPIPEASWEDFQRFLKESFLNFHEFNLGLNEDWPT